MVYLTLIYPSIAAVIATVIEYLRIRSVHGEVLNVNKIWSITIGGALFGACMALSVNYYDDISPADALWYALFYSCSRGFVYNPLLNLFRGLPVNYMSSTTNSKIDRLFRSFWLKQSLYLIGMTIFGYLWWRSLYS